MIGLVYTVYHSSGFAFPSLFSPLVFPSCCVVLYTLYCCTRTYLGKFLVLRGEQQESTKKENEKERKEDRLLTVTSY